LFSNRYGKDAFSYTVSTLFELGEEAYSFQTVGLKNEEFKAEAKV
jgi:hypothetical protein